MEKYRDFVSCPLLKNEKFGYLKTLSGFYIRSGSGVYSPKILSQEALP